MPVSARVAEVLACEPDGSAPVAARAAWLARLADVLSLLADLESDPGRAAGLRADVAAVRASSRLLGLAHARDVAGCGVAR